MRSMLLCAVFLGLTTEGAAGGQRVAKAAEPYAVFASKAKSANAGRHLCASYWHNTTSLYVCVLFF